MTRRVWLTFDDGPLPEATAPILWVLAAYDIRACFFVLGRWAERYPVLLERAVAAGHRVGSHSYDHPHMTQLTDRAARAQLVRTDAAIGYLMGAERLYRPPYGDHDARIGAMVEALGYRTVLWTVDSHDWDPLRQDGSWVEATLERMRDLDDCTVLAHDIYASTAAHLDRFIRGVKSLGDVVFQEPASL